MEQQRSRPQKSIISTGTTSFVLIFVMLSLLTFSVLSLTSAQANLRLSRKSAERTTAYYAAENAANDVLIGLLDAAKDGPEALAAYAQSAGVTVTDESYSYQVPLGEEQALMAEVALDDDGGYRVLTWRVQSQYDWDEGNEDMNLMSSTGLPPGLEGLLP